MSKCEHYTEDCFPALHRRIGHCALGGNHVKCTCDGDAMKCLFIHCSNPVTYGDVYNQFKSLNMVPDIMIKDYRPCRHPYTDYNIPEAIILYLTNDSSIIYIYDEKLNSNN